MLGPRRVALKTWGLDAAKEIDCPSLCHCPSEETQPRLPWGRVGYISLPGWIAMSGKLRKVLAGRPCSSCPGRKEPGRVQTS